MIVFLIKVINLKKISLNNNLRKQLNGHICNYAINMKVKKTKKTHLTKTKKIRNHNKI